MAACPPCERKISPPFADGFLAGRDSSGNRKIFQRSPAARGKEKESGVQIESRIYSVREKFREWHSRDWGAESSGDAIDVEIRDKNLRACNAPCGRARCPHRESAMKVLLIFKVAICNFMESPTCDSLRVAILFACLAYFRFVCCCVKREWRYIVCSPAAWYPSNLQEIAPFEDSFFEDSKIKRSKRNQAEADFRGKSVLGEFSDAWRETALSRLKAIWRFEFFSECAKSNRLIDMDKSVREIAE